MRDAAEARADRDSASARMKAAIQRARDWGATEQAIADHLGVTQQSVSSLLKGSK